MEPTPDEALLTAYLDGELSLLDREQFERRLADEPELREHLTLLEETWHYLSLLEPESVEVDLIEKTLKVTAISLTSIPFVPPRISQICKWSIAMLAGIALCVVCFNVGNRSEFDDPSFRRMVGRFDMYNMVLDDGLDFLRLLAAQRVFLPCEPYEYKPGLPSTELYQLSYRNIQTYYLWSKNFKENVHQIRKLHRNIEKAPQSVELVLTLQNYYHWHNSLLAYERSDLRKPRTAEEKVASIIELKDRLDKLLPDAAPLIPSEIIGIEASPHLAETLANLPPAMQERLLNRQPMQIISELATIHRVP